MALLRGLITAALLVLCLPAAASADVTVDFEAFGPGTTITDQYADLGGPGQGVVFGPLPGAGGSGFAPVVKAAPPGQAHSGTHVADISDCHGCGSEFYAPRTTGTFQSGRRVVRARVGLDGPAGPCTEADNSGCAEVRLQAYNANGDPIGSPSIATVHAGQGFHRQLAVSMPTPAIRGFRISARSGLDSNEPVRIDDLSFDVPTTPPPPDFTVTPESTSLVMSQGQTVSDKIHIDRTSSSSGDVEFSVSGPLPDGVRAHFEPNPAGGPSTDLVLAADPDSRTTGFNPITLNVTATPRSPGTGAEQRTFPVSLQVRSAFEVGVGGPTDVDLSSCTAEVPVNVRRDFGFAGPVTLSASELDNEVETHFENPQVTFPNGAGAAASTLVLTAPATGFPVAPRTLTITASAPGYRDRTTQITVRGTCPAQYDARVTSLEITQGTQSLILPRRHPDHPTAAIRYESIPNRAMLRRGGPTVVRVYANLQFGPRGGVPNVPMVLNGARYDQNGQLKKYPDSPIAPVSGVRHLDFGAGHPGEHEIKSERAVYTFVLPPEWTRQQLSIGAELKPALAGGTRAVRPCDTPICRANDVMILGRIPFVAARSVGVKPVAMPVSGGDPLPHPSEVFRWARMANPLEVRVAPYQATIDISDLDRRMRDCVARAANEKAEQRCVTDAAWAVVGRLGDYSCDHDAGENAWNVGVHAGTGRGAKMPHFCLFGPEVVEDAVVNHRRPIGSVAHEYGHLLGRPHAGRACPGIQGTDEPVEGWSPDDMGFLQSGGLATDQGTGVDGGVFAVMRPPKQWFDFMSYCQNAQVRPNPVVDPNNSWISVRNWNAILRGFAYGSARARRAERARSPRRVELAQGPRRRSLRVSALASSTGASIVGVRPGAAPAQPESASAYRLHAFDAAGRRLADVAMLEAPVQDAEPPSVALEAVVPVEGVARVAVVRDGATLAERTSSAAPPTVSAVRAPAIRRGTATVRWRASDADGDALFATVSYSSRGGRRYKPVWSGPNRNRARIPARVLSRSRSARLRVTVSDGFREAAAASRRFRSPGARPDVRILSPRSGVRQPNDAPLVLSGQAFDDRGRALTGRRLRWFAGKRRLGTGERVGRAGLPAGRHRIDLVARDRFGRMRRDSTVVKLTAARPLFLALSSPKKVRRAARRMRVRVASSLPATLVVRGTGRRAQRFKVGRRARRLTVRVKPGRRALRLRLTLRAGRASNAQRVVVARR